MKSAVLVATVLFYSSLDVAYGCQGQVVLGEMNTYDTGNRLLNGQWSIGSSARLLYLDCGGEPAPAEWTLAHIVSADDGSYAASTGIIQFTAVEYSNSLSGTAKFNMCYRGKVEGSAHYYFSEASVGAGGNTVCTGPPPPSPPPPGGNQCGDPGVICEPTDYCGAVCYSPIIVDVNGDGYALTDVARGVTFDMNGDGVPDRIGWTAAGGDDAFLWLDTNANGVVDNGKELFGNAEYTNGFEKLAVFDAPARGGNGDGMIMPSDAIWPSLLLWTDANHDGRSESGEIGQLSATRFGAISLKYQTIGKRDEFGNLFRFKGRVTTSGGRDEKVYDVIFVSH